MTKNLGERVGLIERAASNLSEVAPCSIRVMCIKEACMMALEAIG